MGLSLSTLPAKKRNQVMAIDLGSRTTKGVVLQRKGNGFELLNFCLLDAPVSSTGVGMAVVTEHLKKVAAELGNRTKQVVLALGVDEAILRQAEMPMVPVSDMRQMLRLSARAYLQQDLPDHLFDCFILPPPPGTSPEPMKAGQKCRTLVGAAKKPVVRDLQAVAKAAGLLPEMIIPGVISPANAFEMAQPETFEKEVVALVDIGFRHSTICVLQNGQLLLNRVLAMGGERLTSGLAEAMGWSLEEAEKNKLEMGEEVQAQLYRLLEPLGAEIHASIDFYVSKHDRPVNQVFVSGGSARSDFIVSTLKTELMVDTKSWNPLDSMTLTLPPAKLAEVEQVASQLTVAVGAALSAF